MTYQDLQKWIDSLTPEQKQMSITIHDNIADEYYPIHHCWVTQEDDVIDKNSPVITF